MTKQHLKTAEENFRAKTRWIASATSETLRKESPESQAKRIERLLLPGQYGRFFDYYFGTQAYAPLSEAPSAEFHIAAYKVLLRRRIITQFRLWFRGAAKSTQTNVGNAFALKCRKQMRFMLLIGSSSWRAKLLLADLQAQLEANERILKDFGPQIQYGHWRDGMFETQDGCYFMALGLNQPFRGLRRYANRIDFAVVDDIEDRKRVSNRSLIADRVDKILGDLGAAFHKERQRLVIANNYITQEGVIAGLLQRLQGKPHVHISRIDLTDKQGKSSWPSYYRAIEITRIHKRYDPYTLQREYYNTPIEEGRVFQQQWLRFLPLSHQPELLIGFWDLSYSSKGDYKAFALIGLCQNGWYVMDIFCRKCELSEAMDWYFALQKRLREEGKASYMYYDGMASQEQVFGPRIRQEGERHGVLIGLPQPYKQLRAEKYLRIETTLVGLFAQGLLHFQDTLENEPDTDKAIEQLLSFARGSVTCDDFPDALAAAIQIGEEKKQQYRALRNKKAYLIGKKAPATGF